MAKIPKPKFISPCVAEKYTRGSAGRIAEFSNRGWNGLKGGLISLFNHTDGSFSVQLYSLDDEVKVSVPPKNLVLSDQQFEEYKALREAGNHAQFT
jgi:hypothetical protein